MSLEYVKNVFASENRFSFHVSIIFLMKSYGVSHTIFTTIEFASLL